MTRARPRHASPTSRAHRAIWWAGSLVFALGGCVDASADAERAMHRDVEQPDGADDDLVIDELVRIETQPYDVEREEGDVVIDELVRVEGLPHEHVDELDGAGSSGSCMQLAGRYTSPRGGLVLAQTGCAALRWIASAPTPGGDAIEHLFVTDGVLRDTTDELGRLIRERATLEVDGLEVTREAGARRTSFRAYLSEKPCEGAADGAMYLVRTSLDAAGEPLSCEAWLAL